MKTLKYQNVISDTTSKTKENVDIDKFLEDEKNKIDIRITKINELMKTILEESYQ